MKIMLKSWRPYLTVLRLRALQETQYRAAALGGLVTQVFFGLVYIFLYTTLYAGDRGEDVKKLQRRLTELGYLNDTIDGIYGQNTKKAVELLAEKLEAKAEVMLDKLEDEADELKDKAENFFDKIENTIEEKLKK